MKKLEPLAGRSRIEASFTQVRRFNALGFEMTSTGNVTVESGKSIIWETLTPTHSRCTLTGDTCRVWTGQTGKTMTLSSRKYPWVAMVFRLCSAWSTGDLSGLRREFDFRTGENGRSLHLTPRSQTVSMLFASIHITFSADFSEVSEVRFTEKGGDTITITFRRT